MSQFLSKITKLVQAVCLVEMQSLWGCLIVGLLLAIPGFVLGVMFGVQIGAPIGARFGNAGYFIFPILIISLFVILFFLIGANIGNFIMWLIMRLTKWKA
jgi:hypothetical protein